LHQSQEVIFVSSLGSRYLLPHSNQDEEKYIDSAETKKKSDTASLFSRRAEYLELFSVLKAADNLHISDITVRSLWGGTYKGNSNEGMNSGVNRSERDWSKSRHRNTTRSFNIISSDRIHTNHGVSDRPLSAASRKRRLQVSQGDVHVLVFLLSHEIPLGEQIIQARRQGAISSASGLYIRYLHEILCDN
jgi:hypothetical protein